MTETQTTQNTQSQQLSQRLNQVAMCIGRLRQEYGSPTSSAPQHIVDCHQEILEVLDRVEEALVRDTSEELPFLVPGSPPGVDRGAIPDSDLRAALIAFSWRPECRGVVVQKSVNRLALHLQRLLNPPAEITPDPHVHTWSGRR